ncbi:hypothetical protein JW859_14310 [bacterium]|nr:hypothetical protein [bacterium]
MPRWLTLVAVLLFCLPGLPAQAQDRHLAITEFYFYPAEAPRFNKLKGYAWPEVKQLNALVRAELSGFDGEERVNVFLVIRDAEDEDDVIKKEKLKFFLPAGEHDMVFADVLHTDEFFDEHAFIATVEVDMGGVKPVYDEITFDITGPEAPDVEILDMTIVPTAADPGAGYSPGDGFEVNALIEIQDNKSALEPTIILFAAMDEDLYLVDPDLNYQPYETHWDMYPLGYTEGVFAVRAKGRLPYYFADAYAFNHDWRVYVIVDFGPGEETMDYVADSLWDHNNGEQRISDDLQYRLIELDRAYEWDVRRMRGGRPETERFWDEDD